MLTAAKDALARLATNVAIVTTSDGTTPHGVTANAWGESEDPPLVLVTLDVAGRTLPLVQQAGRFAVNVLADDQQDLARRFARREEWPGARFSGVTHRIQQDCPLLEGALASFVCRVEAEAPFGSQRIVVGRIDYAELGQADPLIFFDRAFRALAPWTSPARPGADDEREHN